MRSLKIHRLRLFSGVLAMYLLISPAFANMTYTVKSGDSLSKIAKRLSISLNDLVAKNHITDPARLATGQVLTLPDTANGSEQQKTANETNPHQLAQERARLLARSKGEQLVTSAQGLIGTPYVWAGTTSRGIDCSGLVVRSMALQGKNVPHNAAALYKMGEQVSYEQLQPGDLVFFNTRGNTISHVGIWIGDNKFIHASCSNGVVTQKMVGYYAKRLVGARRIH